MSRRTNRAARKRERNEQRLLKEMQCYLRKGFVIRSQTETAVSLTRQLRHGILWRATIGNEKAPNAFQGRKRGVVVNLTVMRNGKIKTSKSKQYI